ncbi:DUF945 domain-containing protein [Nocardiopsis gilva YIM 90087]|uniref:DUF945 domain-containing protein n=1 Tax=Nocardiopsis gilva YIM 90087 TaxID=1235441 RepID=A0A223S037_9ACTN|nr:DUF932 domain-containing protein [Nocardiopsis gilva]ASU81490.1 DUF945 domain-containing protein [Nocardiopsis gilva YIM 90087]
MAHQIETFSDGSAAFASARTDAWHQLGTILPDVFTAEQAMTVARLGNWDVRKAPLATSVPTGPLSYATLDVPDTYATVRTHPETGRPDVLGVVGTAYTPVQNEELAGFLNALVDASGAHFETAGSLRDGREVFVTLKLPQTMTIAGTDEIDLYIAGMNSHDGTTPMRLVVTPIRVVCSNTQAAALRNNRSSFTIRHTSGATGRIEEARQSLGLTWKYLESFQAEAEKMIDQDLADGQFMDIVRDLWPRETDETSRTCAHRDRREAELRALFSHADTNAAIRGTRWAGYQAITEYLDHRAPVRSGALGSDAAARAERTLTSHNVRAVKNKAFDAFALN